MEACVKNAAKELSGLDIVYVNAAVMPSLKPLWEMNDIEKTIQMKATGALLSLKEAIRSFKEDKRRGKCVLIGERAERYLFAFCLIFVDR